MKPTEEMNYKELLFMLIYHLLEKDYHECAIRIHNDEISHIREILNSQYNNDTN